MKIIKKKYINYLSLFILGITATMNVYAAEKGINCGADIVPIPVDTAKIIHNAYLLLKIGTPLILIIMGIADFGRAVFGSNDDDIKKKEHRFIKRVISAILVFLVLSIVEFAFTLLAKAGFSDVTACIDTILSGEFYN